jgi:hypothetical protein
MKIFFKSWFFIVSFTAVTTSVSCEGHSGNEKSEIFRYRRNIGSNNGYKTYSDVLAITNYQNKSLTIDSFAKIAKNYIDTVKAEYPVSGITFIGQKKGGHLPPSNPDYYDSQVKCYLIDFGFSNGLLDTILNFKKVELRSIAIWYDQEKFPKIQLDKKLNKEEALKVDSLLNNKIPFDNGFK